MAELEAVKAEIERFKAEALKMHIIEMLAHTYTIASLFDYNIDNDGSIVWYRHQAKQLWDFWNATKAQTIPEGFMLVEKKNLEDWYFDSNESMWWDEADVFLSGLNAGEVLEVQHKEYLVTDTTPKYAAVVWDEDNQTTGTWELFDSKDEAEKAAAYCAAKVEEQDNE
ncbi:TPA: hypothetical protein ACVB8O_002131 [Acinetobacter baumannii]